MANVARRAGSVLENLHPGCKNIAYQKNGSEKAMPLILYVFIWVLAGFVTGVSSFGGNMFAVPIIALVYDPKVAIVIGCMAGTFMCLLLTLIYRKYILWKEALFITISSLAGIYPGVWILGVASQRSLLLTCAFIIAMLLIWNTRAKTRSTAKGVNKTGAAVILGFAAGVMSGALSMGGPAMGLYIYLTNMRKEHALATLSATAVPVLAGAVLFQYLGGMISASTAGLGLHAAGGGVAGILLSMPLARFINQKIFSRLVFGILVMSVLMLSGRAIM